jgi:hypothetical protein
MTEVVSIRTKNPGAMWPCAIATQFGSTSHEDLRDGNKAAIFPTFEQGAAAQFALWAKNYSGMTLQSAIYKWSGHNSSSAYAQSLSLRVPGLLMSTIITRSFLASQQGRKFMAAQAQWEAGKPYPMTDAQWAKAQELAFGVAKILPPPDIEPVPPKSGANKHTAAGTAGAATGAALNILGLPLWAVVSAAFVVAIAVYLIVKNRK